jgi:DNA-binding GntR family transcriptional regulator
MKEAAHLRAVQDGKRPGEPRYLKIVRQIERDIARERIAVGDHLPGELDLCKRLGVSRFTVRQAIRHLRDSGMVVARRGAGTMVTARSPDRSFIHAVESLDELTQYAVTTRFSIGRFERALAGVQLARRLKCRRGQAWWRAEGYRYRAALVDDQPPICWTEVFVAEEFERIRGQGGSADASIFRFLEADYGERVLEVGQTISAVLVPERIAGTLAVEPGSPALQVDRVYRSARGKVIEVAFSIHPADRFSYAMRLWRDVRR